MNRFAIFLLGLVVGAGGVLYLANAGRLGPFGHAPARTASTAPSVPVLAPGAPAPGYPAPQDITGSAAELTPVGPEAPAYVPPTLPAPVSLDPLLPPVDTGTASAGAVPPSVSVNRLLIPVANIRAGQLTDTFTQSRGGGRVHDAIDIMAATGTPVIAVDDGRVAKLFTSKQGGLTLYQFDPAEKIAYYYAHLDRYADGVTEGQQLKRGDLIGYVGFTGNANPAGPHLHFAIFVLGPEKNWWQGAALNPYPLLTRKGSG